MQTTFLWIGGIYHWYFHDTIWCDEHSAQGRIGEINSCTQYEK